MCVYPDIGAVHPKPLQLSIAKVIFMFEERNRQSGSIRKCK